MLWTPPRPLAQSEARTPVALSPTRAVRRVEPARRSRRRIALFLIILAGALATLVVAEVRAAAAAVASLTGELNAAGGRDWLRSLGMWAPVAYVSIQIAQVLVPFLPSAPVTFAGVLLFGWQAGLALSMAGWLVGSALQFAAVRRWGRPLVARLIGAAAVARYADRLDPRGWWLLGAFLVPFAPADAFSALAGLSPISARRFLLISFLGRLPWAVATVLLATGLTNSATMLWATLGLSATAVLSLALVYRRKT